jgi:Na+/H+-dicarboxylate symporter
MLFAIGWFAISYATIRPLARLFDGVCSLGFGSTLHVLDVLAAIALGCLIVSLVVRPLRTRTFRVSERIFILTVTLAPLIAGLGFAVR